jgi:hypothetical protein
VSRATVRAKSSEYESLDLRAHSLLADVPLHDVWAVDLEGGGPDRSVLDLQELLSLEKLSVASTPVRLLFALRGWLGRAFAWDRAPAEASQRSYVERLTASDRERSLAEPGTSQGPFRVLYASPYEMISEIQNATVHAFSVFALSRRASGYRLHWAIYVRPVGRITWWYMRLIDPFRRLIVYPAVLRQLQRSWARQAGGTAG